MKAQLFLLLAACSTVACSTSATISRRSGSPVDARIVGSDAENVYVQTEGGRQAIPKADVTDVDHPGDAAAVIGAILAGYGAVNIAVGVPKCRTEGGAFCLGVFTPAAIGVPMFLWGLVTHAGSVDALGKRLPSDSARVLVAPIIPMSPEQPAGGAVFVAF